MDSGVTPLTEAQVEKGQNSTEHEGYIHRVLEETDVLLNVVAGGHQDETLSSRTGRDAVEGDKVAEAGSHVLDVFQRNHCATAEEADKVRAEEVIQLEDSSGTLPK